MGNMWLVCARASACISSGEPRVGERTSQQPDMEIEKFVSLTCVGMS